MVEEGLFDRFQCDEVYALHNWPDLPVGHAGIKAGPMMAASDVFTITITGKGGHAAMPQQVHRPGDRRGQMVQAFQPLVSRRLDPLDSAVISVTQIHAGSAFNVIPNEAVLNGTVRTLLPQTRDFVESNMARIAQSLGAAFDVEVHFDYRRGYPPTVNPEREAAIAKDITEDVLGEGTVLTELAPGDGGGGLRLHAGGAAGGLYLARPGRRPRRLLGGTIRTTTSTTTSCPWARACWRAWSTKRIPAGN